MANAKSKMAFQFSIENFPAKIYFWTFTFAEVLEIPVARKRWHNFLSGSGGLIALFPGIWGYRVFEIHPGGVAGHSHGLHIHMVLNQFLPVDLVRSLAVRKGLGKIVHVKQIERAGALYLSKYLSKKRDACLKGVRLWAPVGQAPSTKVRDIIVESHWATCYKYLACAVCGFRELSWNQRLYLTTRFCDGMSIQASFQTLGMLPEDIGDMRDPWDADGTLRD